MKLIPSVTCSELTVASPHQISAAAVVHLSLKAIIRRCNGLFAKQYAHTVFFCCCVFRVQDQSCSEMRNLTETHIGRKSAFKGGKCMFRHFGETEFAEGFCFGIELALPEGICF